LKHWYFAAFILGAGLPALAYRLVTGSALPASIQPLLGADSLLLTASFVLGGAAIGLLLQRSMLLWTFLFSYLCVRALSGFWISWIPYGAIAFWASFSASQFAKRRKLILLPETDSG
jgi:hypothetical protein